MKHTKRDTQSAKKESIPVKPKGTWLTAGRRAAIAVVLCAILGVLFLRFVLGGPEDGWLCEQGKWVKHGRPSYPQPLVACPKSAILPNNQPDCLQAGGVWRRQGLDPSETCNRKAIDRGNLCRDNSECEGMCQVELSREELRQGMKGSVRKIQKYGHCSVNIREFGCQGIVERGRIRVLCVD